jgi:hypothetical protein
MIVEELLEIEHALAAGGGDEYREHLADDAVVIVPAQALDKRATVDVIIDFAGSGARMRTAP